ncbi:MAG: Pvc16 family protein, partial [Ornithinimicrobium sp.]
MIVDVDAALRSILEPGAEQHGAEVSLESPTRDWAAQRTQPTLDIYLFDLKEDLDVRAVAREPLHENGVVIVRRRPPRFFRLAYLLTAWTARPE